MSPFSDISFLAPRKALRHGARARSSQQSEDQPRDPGFSVGSPPPPQDSWPYRWGGDTWRPLARPPFTQLPGLTPQRPGALAWLAAIRGPPSRCLGQESWSLGMGCQPRDCRNGPPRMGRLQHRNEFSHVLEAEARDPGAGRAGFCWGLSPWPCACRVLPVSSCGRRPVRVCVLIPSSQITLVI